MNNYGPKSYSWSILPQADFPENNVVAKFVEWGDKYMWEITTSESDGMHEAVFIHYFNVDGIVYPAEMEVWI